MHGADRQHVIAECLSLYGTKYDLMSSNKLPKGTLVKFRQALRAPAAPYTAILLYVFESS